MDKFPFADDDMKWQHSNYDYPSKPYAKSYKKYSDRAAHITEPQRVKYDWSGVKSKTEKVHEAMESKYEKLIESYKKFATGDPKITPEKKVKHTIKEVAKKSFNNLSAWQKKNPNWSNYHSKQNDMFMKILNNSVSGETEEEQQANYEKIMKL